MASVFVRARLASAYSLVGIAIASGAAGPGAVAATVEFDWATVGNPGNLADTLVMSKGVTADFTTGYGGVDYAFQIATTHVTNSQYVEFLNATDPEGLQGHPILGSRNGVYNPNMSFSTIGGAGGTAYTGGIDYDLGGPQGGKYAVKNGREDYPATWINWDSAARFANWLHNGQGAGDTESGAYDMSITRDQISGPLPRQPGAKFYIPSEDEFYKAAYYDPTKDGVGGYWQYGVRSNASPLSEAPPGAATSANHASAAGPEGIPGDLYWQTGSTFDSAVDYLTEVGAYREAVSYYGLRDVDGLVYQWTEGSKQSPLGDDFPVYRGGAWYYSPERSGAEFRALYSFRDVASYAWFGFRIARPVTAAPGDFDGDGDVDGNDLLRWQREDGSSIAFAEWETRFGAGSSALTFAAPEPLSVVLLATFAACQATRREPRSSAARRSRTPT